ncbi:hypothetical protein DYB32_001014 [Aphanomyces invadans]|uniref:PDEase domain-containing protein n=1 Tax=Aphanomyces invadans TaxID=157072 RepID=A0A418B828_9STRA|nr:hypothetical protein DYB32_001014 [Aphanomyces invadans]
MYDLYHTHRDALALASWLRVFVLAIVFHDIVYDPLSKTNELDSISSFRMFVSDACPSMGSEEIGLVEAMIEATIRHEMPASCNSDAARHVIGSFLDLDLAILSSTNDVYDEYTKQIRMEYIAYSEAEFQQGRAAVLKSFLHRDNLYFTRRFQDEWTAAARANIERELKNLTG